MILVGADWKVHGLGAGGLSVIEVSDAPRHCIECAAQVVQRIANVQRPLMLRYTSWDSGDKVDSQCVFSKHGIDRDWTAREPLAELRLHEGDVRVSAAPLEIGPSGEVDPANESGRLSERKWTIMSRGIGHKPK